MPWVAPIIGYSDNMGVLRCSECAEERHRNRAVPGDSWFGADDECEVCGWRFQHIPTSRYVQVSHTREAPDLRRSILARGCVTIDPLTVNAE